MKVTANEYLDARQSGWIDDELLGHVRFDALTRLVEITPSQAHIVRVIQGGRLS